MNKVCANGDGLNHPCYLLREKEGDCNIMTDEKREKRTVLISLYITPKEEKLLLEKMEETGVSNRSDFIRQMIFDGYCVSADRLGTIMHEFWYCNDRLEIYSNAAQKKGSVYCGDIDVLCEYIARIGDTLNRIWKEHPKMPEPKHFGLWDWE